MYQPFRSASILFFPCSSGTGRIGKSGPGFCKLAHTEPPFPLLKLWVQSAVVYASGLLQYGERAGRDL